MPADQGPNPSGGVIGMANRLARNARAQAEGREQLQRQVTANRAGVETMLCGLLDAFSPQLGGHGRRVTKLVDMLAAHLKVSYASHQILRYAALFHEIGMIGVPRVALFTPWSDLSETDRNLIQSHPQIGAAHLRAIPWYEASAVAVLAHHEYWDGSGFPRRLVGEDIPLSARILTVCDVYDEMLNKPMDSPVRFNEADILEHLRQNRGRKFDPRVVDAFLIAIAEANAHKNDRKTDGEESPVALSQLSVGTCLARDLVSHSGAILLTKGSVLTEPIILRLQALRGANAPLEPVYTQGQ